MPVKKDEDRGGASIRGYLGIITAQAGTRCIFRPHHGAWGCLTETDFKPGYKIKRIQEIAIIVDHACSGFTLAYRPRTINGSIANACCGMFQGRTLLGMRLAALNLSRKKSLKRPQLFVPKTLISIEPPSSLFSMRPYICEALTLTAAWPVVWNMMLRMLTFSADS